MYLNLSIQLIRWFNAKVSQPTTRSTLLLSVPVMLMLTGSSSTWAAKQPRLITLGSSLTEIVYALQQEQQLVGVDSSSQWPKAAISLPQVGYLRNLSAEGVLSLTPSHLLATEDAGPPAVLQQIKSAAIPVTVLKEEKTPAGVIDKIHAVAKVIGAELAGEQLVKQVTTDLEALAQFKATHPIKQSRRVLFLFSVKQGAVLAAGRNTAADAMLQLAGASNVFNEYEGFKPLNSEALASKAPEAILVTDLTIKTFGGLDKILALPGIALTPAAKNRQVIVMDTLYLLGFGPRTGQAALELARQLAQPETQHD